MPERIDSANFGPIEFEKADVVELPNGMLGFCHLHRFLLIEGNDFEPFRFFQSIDEPLVCFPLIEPHLVSSDYRLELNLEEQGQLGLENPSEGLVYSVVTLAENPQDSTANLFAPLVINSSNMRGSQVILLDSGYSVAEPLVKS